MSLLLLNLPVFDERCEEVVVSRILVFKYAAFAPSRVYPLVMVCRSDRTVHARGPFGDVLCNVSVVGVSGV